MLRCYRRLLFIQPCNVLFFFFFFNDTATTEIYTLSLHDALPISGAPTNAGSYAVAATVADANYSGSASGTLTITPATGTIRSEEHTSELQSPCNLVCRLLLEKKKKYSDAIVEPALHKVVSVMLTA